MGNVGELQAIYVLKLYAIFVGILVIGSLIIAYILEDIFKWDRTIVLFCVTAWAFVSYGLMIIIEDRS